MSVIVKGMKMPSECARVEDGEFVHCPFVNTDDDCILQSKVTGTWEEMYQNCPLVALPDHHGRLMDADATIKEIKARNPDDVSYEDAWAITCIEHATTIAEAEDKNADHN